MLSSEQFLCVALPPAPFRPVSSGRPLSAAASSPSSFKARWVRSPRSRNSNQADARSAGIPLVGLGVRSCGLQLTQFREMNSDWKGCNMGRNEGRGRPVIYKLQDRRRLAELVRQHGARGARELTGKAVCVATLLKVANEFGIELKKGRRPRTAA